MDKMANRVLSALMAAEGRMAMLRAVASLRLPDAWVAAGAVRNAVWDSLHLYRTSTPLNDIDVVWFDPDDVQPPRDRELEAALSRLMPNATWSVKNQARMHIRNGHPPYRDCLDAMRFWPETATAVAARLGVDGVVELQAAFGLDDLLALILRPTLPDTPNAPFRERVETKGWLRTWPKLTVVYAT